MNLFSSFCFVMFVVYAITMFFSIKSVLLKDNITKEYLYKEFKIKLKIEDGFGLIQMGWNNDLIKSNVILIGFYMKPATI